VSLTIASRSTPIASSNPPPKLAGRSPRSPAVHNSRCRKPDRAHHRLTRATQLRAQAARGQLVPARCARRHDRRCPPADAAQLGEWHRRQRGQRQRSAAYQLASASVRGVPTGSSQLATPGSRARYGRKPPSASRRAWWPFRLLWRRSNLDLRPTVRRQLHVSSSAGRGSVSRDQRLPRFEAEHALPVEPDTGSAAKSAHTRDG